MIDYPNVPSPCCGVCQCNEEDVCIGCGRTCEEVLNWLNMSDEEKKACKAKSRVRIATVRYKSI